MCRDVLRVGSRSFHAASLLLPRRIGDSAAALYAFCRTADDAVDRRTGSVPVVSDLEARLAAIYGDRPLDDAVDRAFRAVVRSHGIPRAVPEALLEGFRWDEENRTYADLDSLYGYCARVGSTVGVMMTLVMGRRDEETLIAAAQLGLAMQLTNIARDVGEDAGRNRIYLPLDHLRRSGIVDAQAWLASPRFEPAVSATVETLLDVADCLYARSWTGVARLPATCRPSIRAAALMYAEIGNEIRRAGYDSVSRRAWTGRRTKGRILVRAAIGGRRPSGSFPGSGRLEGHADANAADAAVEFLVAAAAGGEATDPAGG
ncbi:MAG: phytoene/squalene synthase family protein [Gemmatimonadota bacterium]